MSRDCSRSLVTRRFLGAAEVRSHGHADFPLMKFNRAGTVIVQVTDTQDHTKVLIKLTATFETTGISRPPDLSVPDDLILVGP